MANPQILNIGTDSTYYTSSGSRTSSSYTVTAPATANTVVFIVGLDDTTTGADLIPTIAWGSRTAKINLAMIPTAGTPNYRFVKVVSFDVVGEGAISETATLTFSVLTSRVDVLGVYCTDGYVQSASVDPQKSGEDAGYEAVFTGDSANTSCISFQCVDVTGVVYTPVQGTEVFEASLSSFSAYGMVQTTPSSGIHTIEYTSTANNDHSNASVILTSRSNLFLGDGTETGPVIKHNVIT
tara:strand:+ start:607 stop:1323 length:717 start_codon:yes stop_codon:yes gene_type:complete